MVHHAPRRLPCNGLTRARNMHSLSNAAFSKQRDGLLGPFGKNSSRASSGARRLQAFASALFALMGAPLNIRIADSATPLGA